MNLHDMPLAQRRAEIKKRVAMFGECFIELMPDGSSRIIENDRVQVVRRKTPPCGMPSHCDDCDCGGAGGDR